MPKLSPTSVPILEGKVVLYKWAMSPFWQARFRIGRKWIRTSTKTENLKEAKSFATDLYLESKFKEKNNIPIVSRRFRAVAEAVKARLQKERDAGVGPVMNKDYINAIDNHLLPFFGNHNVASIDHNLIKAFYTWRRDKLGRDPAKSTVNCHATALKLVFQEAVAQGYMMESQIPPLKLAHRAANGKESERRPDFTLDEYRRLYRFMRTWARKGKAGKSAGMRLLLRDYVLFLANSGIRHGTEAYNLKWKNIEERVDAEGTSYLIATVKGKVGSRTAMLRHNCKRYLERIMKRAHDMQGMSWEQALKVDEYVLRLPDGERTKNLDRTFERLLKACKLLMCPRTDKKRTLYSLRHSYITWALLANKVSPMMVAKQCGTSVKMLEDHYAHLEIWQHREALTA